jgi:hypothetical protein
MSVTIQPFDYSVDLMRSILWQDDTALNLQTLVKDQQNFVDSAYTKFWQDWYTNVFNLDTANDFGLAVWSIILGLPLFIDVSGDSDDKPIWGFDDDFYYNFDRGVFTTERNIILKTEEKRIVLKLRYFQLANRGDLIEINYFLRYVFKDNVIYGLDGLDMSMTYVLLFKMSQNLFKALMQYDLFPRPAAVKLKFYDGTLDTFGFDLETYKNFDNGYFYYGS